MALPTRKEIIMCLHNQLGFHIGSTEERVSFNGTSEKIWDIRYNDEIVIGLRAKSRSKSEMQMVCDFANKLLEETRHDAAQSDRESD